MPADGRYTPARALGLTDCLICGAAVAVKAQQLHNEWHLAQLGAERHAAYLAQVDRVERG
jgi:hypothetical protein